MSIRIGYYNTDEVDQAVAARMARGFGAVVCGLHPKDRPRDGAFDAFLYNLDDVPAHRRCDVLAEILHERSDRPRAVHGYTLSEAKAALLRLHGVVAAQRL